MMFRLFALRALGLRRPKPHASRRALRGVVALFVLCGLFISPAFEAQALRVPTQKEMQDGCIKTGGQWRALPPECDNMHPRSWEKLSGEQQKNCMATFNEPCECGSGKRFIYMGSVGCEKSNFPDDK